MITNLLDRYLKGRYFIFVCVNFYAKNQTREKSATKIVGLWILLPSESVLATRAGAGYIFFI
jgi:hypothetical protein